MPVFAGRRWARRDGALAAGSDPGERRCGGEGEGAGSRLARPDLAGSETDGDPQGGGRSPVSQARCEASLGAGQAASGGRTAAGAPGSESRRECPSGAVGLGQRADGDRCAVSGASLSLEHP